MCLKSAESVHQSSVQRQGECCTYLGDTTVAISILGVAALFQRPVNRLALLFLGTALLENLVSSLRWGSYIYYFLPTLAALTVFAASEIDALLEYIAKLGKLAQVVCGIALALLIGLGNLRLLSPRSRRERLWHELLGPRNVQISSRNPDAHLFGFSYRPPWDERRLQRLSSIRGPVLTDFGALALVDDSPGLRPIDMLLLGSMRPRGEVNDTALLTAIRCRRFAAIALDPSGLNRQYRGHFLSGPNSARLSSQTIQSFRRRDSRF